MHFSSFVEAQQQRVANPSWNFKKLWRSLVQHGNHVVIIIFDILNIFFLYDLRFITSPIRNPYVGIAWNRGAPYIMPKCVGIPIEVS